MKVAVRAQPSAWIFFLAATAVLCRGLFQGKVLIDLGGDELKCYLSSAVYMHQWIQAGIFPFWNTLSLCGHPFGIHAISSYNFLNLAAMFLDATTAYSLVIFLGVFLNGYFFYLFLRRKSVGVYGALVAGGIWMLAKREIEIGFFFLPLLFLLADLYAERFRRLWFLLLTLALALYFLNANPHGILYNTIFLLVYLAWLVHAFGSRWEISAKVLLPFILAAGLTAFYYLGFFELLSLSNRSSRSEIVAFFPTHYALFLFPKLFNAPGRPEIDFMIPRIFQSIFSSIPFMRTVEVFVSPLYLGAGAVLAFFTAPRTQRWVRFFSYAAIGAFVYVTLHPLLYLLCIRYIPVLQGLVAVHRFFLIGEFSMLVILAVALDDWLEPREEIRRKIIRTARRLVMAISLFGVVLVLTKWVIAHFHERLAAHIVSNLKAATNPSIFLEDFASFSRGRVQDFFDFFNRVLSWTNPHLIWPILVIAVLIGMIYAYQSRRISRRVFQAAFFAWTVLDLGLVVGLSRPAWTKQEIFKSPTAAAVLKKDPGLFRVLMVEDSKTPYSKMFLVPEANMSYNIATPDGYEYLYLKRYVHVYEWLTERPEGMGPYIHPLHHFNRSVTNFLNVKYFFTSVFNEKLDSLPFCKKIWEGDGYKIYENLEALPRAFVLHRAVFFPEESAASRYIAQDFSRLTREVVLVGTPAPGQDLAEVSSAEPVHIRRYWPQEILLETELKEPGYLVMSDNYYPGWRVEVDGRAESLLRADYTFRAVFLAKGKHQVRFVYKPIFLTMGLWISLAALGLGIAVLFLPRFWK